MIVQYLNSINADIVENSHDIDILRESVINILDSVGKSLYESKTCNKEDLKKAADLTEEYVNICNNTNNIDFIREAHALENNFALLADAYSYMKQPLNEWFARGFETYDNSDHASTAVEIKPRVEIKKVGAYISKPRNNFRNGSMFADKHYSIGDIIEEAPVRIIHIEDTYSRPIRDLSFEVDAEQGIYAIPMGYASYYKPDEYTPNATYSFTYNPETGTGYITIRAGKSISRGDEITVKKSQKCLRDPNYDRFKSRTTAIQEVPVTNFRFQ